MNAISELPSKCRSPDRGKKGLVQTGVNVKGLLSFWEQRTNNYYVPSDTAQPAHSKPWKTKTNSQSNSVAKVSDWSKEAKKHAGVIGKDQHPYPPKLPPKDIPAIDVVTNMTISPSLQEFRNKKALVKRNSAAEFAAEIRTPLKRSKSADSRVPSKSNEQLLGARKTRQPGGVKTELRDAAEEDIGDSQETKRDTNVTNHTFGPEMHQSHNKISLDELITSNHHKRVSYHRRSSLRRFELQKALSHGRIEDLTKSFHSTEYNELKESLHRAQVKAKQATAEHPDPWSRQELAKELSNVFVNALFLDEEEGQLVPKLTVQQVQHLVMELSVDEMIEIIKHFELCESNGKPVRWDLIQSIVYPDLDDEEQGDMKVESYHTGDSSSYIMSDDGEGCEIVDLDDESDAPGFFIEAYTASCNSSITGFWSLYSDDGSFAEDDDIEMVIIEDEEAEI